MLSKWDKFEVIRYRFKKLFVSDTDICTWRSKCAPVMIIKESLVFGNKQVLLILFHGNKL